MKEALAVRHLSSCETWLAEMRSGMFRNVKGEMLSVKKALFAVSRCILEYYKNLPRIAYLPQIFLRWKTNV